jgi:hypothetical protein
MLRATVWTVGLFGAGTAISRLFPGTWTEPLVLLALGVALLFASARTARTTVARPAAAPPRPAAPEVERPVAAATSSPAIAAAAATVVQGATVPVERTA